MLVAVCFDIYVQGRRERGGGGHGACQHPPVPTIYWSKNSFRKNVKSENIKFSENIYM